MWVKNTNQQWEASNDQHVHPRRPDPEGRPAADEELATLLGGMTTADGTSILDIWRDTRDQD